MEAPVFSLYLFLCFFAFSGLVRSQSDSCSTDLAVSLPFNTSSFNCLSAWSAENFILRYAKTGTGVWSYVLSAPDTGSYIAVGFSPNGKMVGSSAMVGWIPKTGSGVVKQYALNGESTGMVLPDQGDLILVKNTMAIVSQSSTLYMSFQLLTLDQPQPYLIYAVGPNGNLPSANSYQLSEHKDKISTAVNLSSGVLTDANSGGGGGGSGLTSERKHALLVLLGWGVLMPIGVLAARYFKHHDPHWFYGHISIQAIGFGLGLAGIIIGFGLDDTGIDNVDAHKGLGVAILVFGSLQVLAFLARPDKTSKVRKYWNWYHHYIGRTAIACGIANIFFGLAIANESNSWFIGYGVFLAIWVITTVFLEIRKCMSDND